MELIGYGYCQEGRNLAVATMTKINYTASSDSRSPAVPLPSDVVRIELQGSSAHVTEVTRLLRQQTEVLEESADSQASGENEVRRHLVVKTIVR